MRNHRMRTLLAAHARAACAGTSVTGCDDVSTPAPPEAAHATALPAALRARALEHVRGVAAAGLADAWRDASLGDARPIFRSDVDGVAYWEVAVVAADG